MIATIREQAERFGVGLNWKRQDQFVRMARNTPSEDPAETAAVYDQCWLRERCHLVRDGVFYTCTRPPHLQTFYRGRRDFSDDGIVLDERAGLREELLGLSSAREARRGLRPLPWRQRAAGSRIA